MNSNQQAPLRWEVGTVIGDGTTTKRVLLVKEDIALLECWENGKLIQYCVAHGIYEQDGQLYWQNGNYFLCVDSPDYDTPSEAFMKAVNSMQAVNVVHVNTSEDDFYHVFGNEASARAYLQELLNANHYLQDLYKRHGYEELSTSVYLEHRYEIIAEEHYSLSEMDIEY